MGHSTRVFTLILETSNKLYDRYVLTTPEDILNVLEKILNESKSTKTR